ncbi:diaminopimelate decarboxylase [Halobacillus karajensis]|uniref:type III PLP-dependent enzyme n=1 Tax=Halobacillus karajensis TaxID=195088 RepID=UPI0008A7E5F3|nr:type III PLP-dependent enzyme [Halobacillus karajensis]SEH98649.1 diaminopimelate decarboxylase [Halobacillus karajensis]
MKMEHFIEQKKQQSKKPLCAYLYDLKKLKTHACELKNSLPEFCRLFYAVKANPDERFLSTLAPILDGFEVASGGEMEKAARFKRPLLFGAPAKKDWELVKAMDLGVEALNVESFHDLNRIGYLSNQRGTPTPVLIRVNLNRDVPESHHMMSGVPTQFGVDEREVPSLLRKAKSMNHISIKGFHFHAMSNNLSAQAHLRFVESCLGKSKTWRDQFDLPLSMVDVGGGIGINYWNPEDPFDWVTLAAGLHRLEDQMDGLTLVLELGRFLTAACGSYVTEVLDVKKNHDQSFALLRGGSHHLRLPAAWKMNHPFRIHAIEEWPYPFERPEVYHEKVTITGELCTPNDVLVKSVYVPRLRAGDVVIFEYAGAYAWTISHHEFLSHPEPEFVYLHEA